MVCAENSLYDDVYRAIDFIYEGNQITCGDKLESVTGKLQFDISSQYDKQQEHILYSPLIKADNALINDLELETSGGVCDRIDKYLYQPLQMELVTVVSKWSYYKKTFVYDNRVLWRKVGRVRRLIGFKFRVIAKGPVTLSGLSIRVT